MTARPPSGSDGGIWRRRGGDMRGTRQSTPIGLGLGCRTRPPGIFYLTTKCLTDKLLPRKYTPPCGCRNRVTSRQRGNRMRSARRPRGRHRTQANPVNVSRGRGQRSRSAICVGHISSRSRTRFYSLAIWEVPQFVPTSHGRWRAPHTEPRSRMSSSPFKFQCYRTNARQTHRPPW